MSLDKYPPIIPGSAPPEKVILTGSDDIGQSVRVVELQDSSGKIIYSEPIVDPLPHILWRVAKQLVTLLEKEYGFGK